MKKTVFAFIAVLLLVSPLFGAYNSWGIPDSSEIREQLSERWFENTLENVRTNMPEVYINSAGQKFQIRLEEAESTFNIFVSPSAEINVRIYSDKGTRVERQEVFPGDNAGSWVLVRDKRTGKPLRIRYYFSANSEVYVQFTPHNKIALADMVIFDNYVKKGIPTGVPFTSLYKASFQDVLDITKNILPWEYVTVDHTIYHSNQQMAAVIRENLPYILFVQDAMYDENNELIKISNGKPFDKDEQDDSRLYLSSAGFVKWIADGLVEPVAGSQLKREPLIQPTTEVKDIGYQGVLSQKYDLFFSLNWIRNLASAVTSVYTGRTYLYNESGTDVTVNPFSGTISGNTKSFNGISNSVTFVQDSGYNVGVLKSLMYLLAATEPDMAYFGAIRGTDRTVTPEIKAFNECVIFLPYFKSNDLFDCFVFMNGRAMTLEDFCLIYKEELVYLTKVRASENFFPYSVKETKKETVSQNYR